MAAGATLQALQQGRAGVAVVFSTDPSLTNPDIIELQDDRGMFGSESLFPLATARVIDAYGQPLRTRITTIGKRLSTAELRRMNGEVASGMRPRDAAAGFVRRARLGGTRALRRGPRIAVGAQDFVESRLVALVYAQALRSAGFNASVADVGGFRDRAYDALYRNRVQLLVDYGSSALDHVAGFPGFSSNDAGRVRTLLTGWMRRYRITVFPSTGAGSRNRFVVLRATAESLGLRRLSDLASLGYRRVPAPGRVPAVAAAAPDDRRLFILRVGSRGPDVRAIQERLSALGYFVTPFRNNVFDETTRRAVVAFQEDHRLVPDGAVGRETFNTITRAQAGSIRPTPPARPGDPGTVSTPTTGRVLYLTFGGGPSQFTSSLLNVLRRHRARATFFLNGDYARSAPGIARNVVSAGHAIGITTMDYPNLDEGRAATWQADLVTGRSSIRAVTGRGVQCVRPPFGVTSAPQLRRITRALDLRVALWNVDTQDWLAPGVAQIRQALVTNARGGMIYRLEDGGGERGQTVTAVDQALGILADRGFTFARLPGC